MTLSNARPVHHSGFPAALMLLVMFAQTCSAAMGPAPMRFERLGLEDGLSQQSVNAIAQDARGFLWFATEDGLNRFDGYSVEHIRQMRSRPESLPDNFVADIELDPTGNLWVATDGGGIVRQTSNERDFEVTHTVLAKGLERVRVIRFDRSGTLWIGSRDSGLAAYNPNNNLLARWRHEAAPESLADDSIFALLEDSQHYLWVGTGSGLDRIDLKTRTLEHIPLQSVPAGQSAQVRSLLEDHFGQIWVGTDAGLLQLHPRALTQRRFLTDTVNVIHEDRAGRLWIGTNTGLALFRRETETFDRYQNDAGDPTSLPDSHVVSIFEDRGGLIWVGTKFGGAGKWNPRTWAFGHQLSADGDPAHRNIMAFTEDRSGRLWTASFGGGITITDRARASSITLNQERNGLSDDHVMTLLTDSQGLVWAGTMTGGLNRIEPRSLAVTVFRHDPDDARTLGAPGVMSLLEDSAHRLWVGTYGGGLSRLDRGASGFHRYLPQPDQPNRLGSGRITALAQDQSGQIWIGSDGGGLHVLDPATDRIERFRRNLRDATSLSSDTIFALHVDSSGTVWVGSRGGGVDRVVGSSTDPKKIRFKNYSEAQGLPNNTVYGIRSDAHGDLWLSTNFGLARLDPRTDEIRTFHARNGLQGEEFNFGAHFRSRRDELFFGGSNGFNAFDPSAIEWSYAAPSVVLTGVFAGNKPLAVPAAGSPVLKLPHQHDLVSFEFAALDFAEPRSNTFQYKLEGYTRSWVNAGHERRVSYSNLPGGDYVLRARAANADGTWNEQGAQFAFAVAPPLWATWQAYTLYTGMTAITAAAILFARQRRKARELIYMRRLEMDVLSRTRELAERNAELERVNEKLEAASLSDPLTGLGNRRSLGHSMPSIVSRVKPKSERFEAEHMILMVIDLDRLKPINDEFGHEAGDRLLAGVSAVLLDCVRSADKVVRWGGDEFVVVSAPLDFDGGVVLAERIRASIARRRFPISPSQLARTSCSIGFARYPFVEDDPYLLSWEQTLNIADVALYRAKARRNAWIGWTGTRNAAGLDDLPGLIVTNPSAAVNGGLVDERICAPTGDETIEKLLRRKCS
jgi:diguanylate cyclase (GGDEF)-like protein